jgi:Arc/MetJ family transcription regulator
MSGRRLAGIVAAVGLLAVSLLLALLAADVLRVDRALAQGDARFGPVSGRSGMWEAETLLPAGISRRVLGVGDDLAHRTAVQRFRLARPREPVQQFSQLTVRAGADRRLARAARAEQDPRRRARLHNLRGALALEESRLGSDSGPPTRRAVTQFRLAVELDPTLVDAQYNLELALRLLARSADTSGGSGERASTPASGAGAGTAGRGY